MKIKFFNLIPTLLATTLLMTFGCAGQSRIAMDYGTSFNLAKFNQIAYPDALKDLSPVYGFDGRAADKAMGTYIGDFEKPAQPSVYKLSFGDSSR